MSSNLEETRPVVFLGYTSNLVSSGVREHIRWLVEHKHVTHLVTTAGGIEEDIIKCLAPTFLGSFTPSDEQLHHQHINRAGNLLIPNANYGAFEEWIMPIFAALLEEQEASQEALLELQLAVLREVKCGLGATSNHMPMTKAQQELADFVPRVWRPSTIIARLGQEINNSSSILTWAWRNNIPVFCPALTDGSFGDMLSAFQIRTKARSPFPYMTHTYNPTNVLPYHQQGLIVDIAADIDHINSIARTACTYKAKMGAIILGSGVIKHHIMNACLNGGGADAAVYINTADEYDGSDAGARPSEAVSWGKLKVGASSVKVRGDATILLPMLVAGTWARVEKGNA